MGHYNKQYNDIFPILTVWLNTNGFIHDKYCLREKEIRNTPTFFFPDTFSVMTRHKWIKYLSRYEYIYTHINHGLYGHFLY